MRSILVSAALLVAASAAHAQSVGTLRATVVDTCGRPVVGATISFDGLARTATASAPKASLAAAGLPGGVYVATVAAIGYPEQRISFEISGGRITDIGTITMGGTNGACRVSGFYRDVSVVRVLARDVTESSTRRSVAFEVVKGCEGDCR
jgi:hypothetical protein